MMKDYPMGIKADAIQVTDDGVSGQLSTTNATIPAGGNDACFTSLWDVQQGRLTPPWVLEALSVT